MKKNVFKRTKKLLVCALAVTMAFGAVPLISAQQDYSITAQAAYTEKENGNLLKYDYDANYRVLTVKSGTYNNPYFDEAFFGMDVKKIVIGEGVVLTGSCEDLFNGCEVEEIDLTGANTSNVTNMKSMFSCCRKLQKLTLTGINTSKVTSLEKMFFECKLLEDVDFSGFDTSRVTNMREMFDSCESLKTLDLSSFKTPAVKEFDNMFSCCYELTYINLSNFVIYTNDTDVSYYGMFSCSGKLNKITISDKMSIKENMGLKNEGYNDDITGMINGWKKKGTSTIVSGSGSSAEFSGKGTYVQDFKDTGLRHYMEGSTLYLTAGEYDKYKLSAVCASYGDGWDAYWNNVVKKIVFGKDTKLAGDCSDMFCIFQLGYSAYVEFEGVVDLSKVTDSSEMFASAAIKQITFAKGTKITKEIALNDDTVYCSHAGAFEGWVKESEPDKLLPEEDGYPVFTADGGKYIHLRKIEGPLVNMSYINGYSNDGKNISVVLGDKVELNGYAEGGDTEYTYTYMYKKTTSTTWTKIGKKFTSTEYAIFKPSKIAEYDVRIIVKDGTGSAKMKTFKVSMVYPLQNLSTVNAETVKVGEKIVMKGAAKGGNKGYSYAFYYKKASKKDWEWTTIGEPYTTKSAAFRPGSAVPYDVKIVVNDAFGRSKEIKYRVNVAK